MISHTNAIPRLNIDYNFKDFFFGFRSLISKRQCDIKILYKTFNTKSIFFTNSGRLSLYIILKALKLPKGSKIGVPLFCCSSVFDAIYEAGYIPIFIDINPETYTIDISDLGKKINDLDALIVIHSFGNPADINEIKKLLPNLPIIEDCAHSILSLYEGKMTGTLGDFSFFSFRLGKYISAGEGGMIIVNNDRYIEEIKNEINKLPFHSFYDETLHIFMNIIKSLLYKKISYGILTQRLISISEKKDKIYGKVSIKKYRIRKTDLSVMVSKITLLDKNIKEQIINSKRLIEYLQNTTLKFLKDNEKNRQNRFYFPIRFKNQEQRDFAYKYLTKKGIGCVKLYHGSVQIVKNIYNYKNDCQSTEDCVKTILIIPNFYTISNKDLSFIAREISNLDEKFKSLAIG